METFDYTVTDPNGLHARPAGLLVRKAQSFDCQITVRIGDKSADLKKLLAVMGLGILHGDTVTVEVRGTDCAACARELKHFFAENI